MLIYEDTYNPISYFIQILKFFEKGYIKPIKPGHSYTWLYKKY